MTPGLGAFLILVTTTLFLDGVKGECCLSYRYHADGHLVCWDGTEPTPCCGVGSCNIFCCNCEGDCRFIHRSELSGTSGFDLIDLDRDGLVNMTEAETYLRSGACGNPHHSLPKMPAEFARLDLNLDGLLCKAEIDS